MTVSEMNSLSKEELIEVSNRKNHKGCATVEALKAQKILWERANCCAGLSENSSCDMDGNSYRGLDL